jgi:hypothetical protein
MRNPLRRAATMVDLDGKGNLVARATQPQLSIATGTAIKDEFNFEERNLFWLFLHIFCRSFGKMLLLIPFFLGDMGLISGLLCFLVVSILFFIKIEALVKTALAAHTFSLTEMAGRAFGIVGFSFFLFIEFLAILTDYYLMIIQIDVIFIFYFDVENYFR